MQNKDNIWPLLVAEIERISPPIYETLNPPAGAAHIDMLEAALGQSLPPEFAAYLRVFNGQTDQGRNTPFIGNNRFLPIDEIIKTMQQQDELFGDEEPLAHIKENKVKPVLWNRLWLPFADFESSSRLILDMDAGKNGRNGQIIFDYPGVDREGDDIVVASSFADFSHELLHRLQTGKFMMDAGRITFDNLWII